MPTPASKTDKSDKAKSFGHALRFLRIKKGLSHHDLADRVGVKQHLVKEWENEISTPSVVHVKKLCGTLPMVRHFLNTLPLGYDVLIRDTRPEDFGHRVLRTDEAIEAERQELNNELKELKTNTFAETFGGCLKFCRLEEGLSQDELGEAVGVTGQAVSAWESDIASPVRENYEKLKSMFVKLVDAPTPPMQNRAMPDGGKGQPKPKMSTWRDKMLAAIGMAPPDLRHIAATLKQEVEQEISAKQFQEELDGLIAWAKSLKQHLPVHVSTHSRHWPNTVPEEATAPVETPTPAASPAVAAPSVVFVQTLPRKLDYEPIPLPDGSGLSGAGARYATALANLEKAQGLREGTKALFEEATIYHDLAQESVTAQHQSLLEEAKKNHG